MQRMITAHMVVKNEDQWVWYAIQSVLPYVDRFLICDTGSTDKTIAYIKTIHDKKIELTQIRTATPEAVVEVRNQQLQNTSTKWLWMVDGDEIYPAATAEEIVKNLSDTYVGIVVRRRDCLGDVFHYQDDESVGAYTLAGKTGHYNLRLLNCSIPGLHLAGAYPQEGFFDHTNQPIIEYAASKFYVTKTSYLHTTYLKRSSNGGNLTDTYHRQKYKYELGKPTPHSQLQDILDIKPPAIIPIPKTRDWKYTTIASVVTPIKKIKRKLI